MYPSYLMHYGVKGQKWGERRWQYEDGSLTPEGYIHYYGNSAKQRRKYLETRKKINSSGITEKDIRQLYGSTYISDLDNMYKSLNYDFNKYSGLGETKLSELNNIGGVVWNDNDSDSKRMNAAYALEKNSELNLDDELIMKSVTRRINPNYGEKGTTNNCVRCSTAMTLAKMGYSTPQGISAGRAMLGASNDGFSYWFDGAEKIDGDIDSISDELSKQPKGSFGVIDVSRFDANDTRIGGHSMTYSILHDGKVRVEDGQCGKMFNTIEDAINNCAASKKGISITRLDNTKPNINAIAEDNMIDVGGSRSKNDQYMPKTVTSIRYNNDDNKVTSYDWKMSGRRIKYSEAGRKIDETLGGSNISDVIYDELGRMFYRG